MSENNLKEINETLKKIYEKGFEIRDILKEKHNHSSGRPVEEVLIDPELFYYSLFESFWKLFESLSCNIENPLIQPWIRIIIEQSSDIFLYSKKSENEKKEIACKYWLCALGFVGGKQGNLNYDNFLNFLDNQKAKPKFIKLKENGYSIKEIHKLWHELFSPINENSLPSLIEEYFINLKGNFINKSQLDLFYRDMSLYHHPNILIINNLETELINKSHIFRCFTLMSACAISLIKFSVKEIIKKPEIDFSEDFYRKINELIKKLYLEGKNG